MTGPWKSILEFNCRIYEIMDFGVVSHDGEMRHMQGETQCNNHTIPSQRGDVYDWRVQNKRELSVVKVLDQINSIRWYKKRLNSLVAIEKRLRKRKGMNVGE